MIENFISLNRCPSEPLLYKTHREEERDTGHFFLREPGGHEGELEAQEEIHSALETSKKKKKKRITERC